MDRKELISQAMSALGKVKSRRKTRAARENAKLGGAPPKLSDQQVRTIRGLLGSMSQEAIARKYNVSVWTISRIATGKRKERNAAN